MYQNSGRSKVLGIKVNNSKQSHGPLHFEIHPPQGWLFCKELIHMCDQKNKQMFITGLRYGNDCQCSLPNSCVVWCVYSERVAWVLRSRVGHNVNHPPRSLVWFWSRQFATQQMRWIMLIHGGELCKNVCFTVWLVCAHVYSCLDNRALSNRDCGLISPRQAPSVIYKLQSGRPQMWHVNGCFDDWADVGRWLCWL